MDVIDVCCTCGAPILFGIPCQIGIICDGCYHAYQKVKEAIDGPDKEYVDIYQPKNAKRRTKLVII